MERLNVYLCGRLAGCLDRADDGSLSFRYDVHYRTSAGTIPMKVDGKFDFRWVSRGKFVRTFARAGIGEKIVCDSIARQVAALKTQLPPVVDRAEAENPSPVYHDIVKGIWRRMRQLG